MQGSTVNQIKNENFPNGFGPLFAEWDEDPDAPDPDQNVVDFVDRLYDKILGRLNDPEGIAYWKKAILDKRWTPQDLAREFLLSKEFLAEDYDEEELLDILYRALMGREPDEKGKAWWLARWEAAADKDAFKKWMISHFIASDEFTEIVEGFDL